MREIKFRAWDKKEKRMLGYDMLRLEDMFIDAGYGLVKIFQLNPNLSYTSGVQKDFELMQFTGLKDKNGKEIYEGDIVKIKDLNKNFVVNWSVMGFTFSELIEGKINVGSQGYFDSNFTEVIGNIYENKELLK